MKISFPNMAIFGVYVKFLGCIKFNVRNTIEIVSFTNRVLYRLFEVVKQPFRKVPIGM